MRYILILITVLCLAITVTYVAWKLHKSAVSPTSITSRQATNAHTLHASTTFPPPPPPNKILGEDWSQLKAVRDATLKNNPKLASEFNELVAEMNEQQKELDAAMIKADPKVADILIKVEKMRKQTSGIHTASTSN